MKKIFGILIFFCCLSAQSQEFGASALKVVGVFDKFGVPVYYKWLRQPAKNDVIMKFEKTPKGLESAMKMVKRLLLENELDFDNPDIYKSYIKADIAKTTPAALNRTLQEGESTVLLGWFASDGGTLYLNLSKGSYEVNVLRAYDEQQAFSPVKQ